MNCKTLVPIEILHREGMMIVKRTEKEHDGSCPHLLQPGG